MAINVFTASGNIGKDCEVRVTPAGKHIATFPLPVKHGYGEYEKTSWIQCKLFGGQAEKLPHYLTKGVKVVVTGEFVLEEWQDKDGNKRSTPTIIVSSLEFASQSNGNQAQKPQQQSTAPQNSGYQSNNQRPAAPAQQRMPMQGGYVNNNAGQPMQPPAQFDDDIPF